MTKKNEYNGDFEGLLSELQTVVTSLEKGELSLEDSLNSYEKGVSLVKTAQKRLGEMEGRIEKLWT